MNPKNFKPGETLLQDAYGESIGIFLGWDEDGEARILFDGYNEEDASSAYKTPTAVALEARSRLRFTAYTFDSSDQRVPLGEHLTADDVKELRHHTSGVVVDEED